MKTGQRIKLILDFPKMEKYFSLDETAEGGHAYHCYIDHKRFLQVESLLKEFDIYNGRVIHEFCFIILWIEKEIRASDDQDNLLGKHYQMWLELDELKQYLMKHRITSVSFRGEYEKNKPGKAITLKEEHNIDRICDGIRAIFKNEFNYDNLRYRKRGQTNWKRKMMEKVKNNMLKYMETIPDLDILSLEDQNYIIGKLAAMAGFDKL
jgi:hypothetical protein